MSILPYWKYAQNTFIFFVENLKNFFHFTHHTNDILTQKAFFYENRIMNDFRALMVFNLILNIQLEEQVKSFSYRNFSLVLLIVYLR